MGLMTGYPEQPALPPMAPPPKRGSGRLAFVAFIFSVAALGLSTYLFIKDYNDGQLIQDLKRNLRTAGEETRRLIDTRFRDREAEEGPSRAPEGLQWEKIRERIERVEAMAQRRDDKAGVYLDVLIDDLRSLREFAPDEAALVLSQTLERLDEASARLTSEPDVAARRLREAAGALPSPQGAPARQVERPSPAGRAEPEGFIEVAPAPPAEPPAWEPATPNP